MSSYIKGVYLMAMLLSIGVVVKAQTITPKFDKIYKLDKSIIECLIDEVNNTEILYKKMTDIKGPLYALPRKEIWKIVWNNGDVEMINDISAATNEVQKATEFLVKKKVVPKLFWDQTGFFAGLKAVAGISQVSGKTEAIKATPNLAYGGGLNVGYRLKGGSVEVEAIYTVMGFEPALSNFTEQGITAVKAYQPQVLIPLTYNLLKGTGKLRLGISLGGYVAVPVGSGGLSTTYTQIGEKRIKNCTSCAGEMSIGALGGIKAILTESTNYSIYLDARWFQNLNGNNKAYRIGENGAFMNAALLGAGVIFSLPKQK